ncbi:structure-specific endonuclease subunit SLX4 (BTB/POZ domain-containing protein 12), partial [Schistosoma bovis]
DIETYHHSNQVESLQSIDDRNLHGTFHTINKLTTESETMDNNSSILLLNNSPTCTTLSPILNNDLQVTTPKHFYNSWLEDETTPSPLMKRIRLSNNDEIVSNSLLNITTITTDVKNSSIINTIPSNSVCHTVKSILTDSVVDFFTTNSFHNHNSNDNDDNDDDDDDKIQEINENEEDEQNQLMSNKRIRSMKYNNDRQLQENCIDKEKKCNNRLDRSKKVIFNVSTNVNNVSLLPIRYKDDTDNSNNNNNNNDSDSIVQQELLLSTSTHSNELQNLANSEMISSDQLAHSKNQDMKKLSQKQVNKIKGNINQIVLHYLKNNPNLYMNILTYTCITFTLRNRIKNHNKYNGSVSKK